MLVETLIVFDNQIANSLASGKSCTTKHGLDAAVQSAANGGPMWTIVHGAIPRREAHRQEDGNKKEYIIRECTLSTLFYMIQSAKDILVKSPCVVGSQVKYTHVLMSPPS